MLLVPNPVYAFQPNDFTSQTYQDANGDGAIDRVIVVINGGEALTQCTVDATELASDWTYVGGPTFGGSLASATCDTATATITFTLTGTAALVTGGGTMPTIAYNDNDFDASIRNASGGLMPVTAKNIVDGARPVIISAFTGDNNRDGTIDRLGLMFSESVTVTDGGTDNDITLTASSGTATITAGSYTTSGTTLTYTISTSVTGDTSLTVTPTYATTGAGSIVDASANEMANGETVTGTDGAGPVLMSANPTHSKTGVRSTQSITLTYSEAPASWSGSITGGVSLSAATGTATVTLTHVARFLTGINAVTISSSPDAGGNAFAGSQTGNTTVANPLVFQVTSGSSSDTSSQEDISYRVNLLFPEEDEFLNGGEYTDIRWESEGGSVSYVNLSYSKNGGDDWRTIALHERNDGVFRWMTPGVNSDEVMVKISLTDLASELATDTSDVFTLWFSDEDGSMGVGDEEDSEVSDEENITQGSYIKLENSPAIYYIDALLTRRPFFDAQTFFTYEDDFDDVLEVSPETLASFPVGAPMLPKAGVALVKIQSVEKVYMVEEASDGSYELRWITSEEVAEDMFGSQWSSYVLDIDVTLFVRYKKGEGIDSAIPVDTDYMKYREDLHE